MWAYCQGWSSFHDKSNMIIIYDLIYIDLGNLDVENVVEQLV